MLVGLLKPLGVFVLMKVQSSNFAVLFILCSVSLFAQDEEKSEDNKSWRKFCDLTAQNVSVFEGVRGGLFRSAARSTGREFQQLEHAIFEHKNPFNQTEHGLVYLWKQEDGRPVAIFTSLVNKSPRDGRWGEIIEYHSLHDKPLYATFGSDTIEGSEPYRAAHAWRPSEGIKWNLVPKADDPANSAVRLRGQARSIVRRFECEATFYRRSGPQQYSLRPLAKPVYTYDAKREGKLVGGLLTFYCRATDPEALLLLDVRPDDSGKLAWHYAVGNFTRGRIRFSLDKKEIWDNNSSNSSWFNPTDVHYGNFPARHLGSFTIEEGIERQKEHLDAASKDS